MFSNDKKPKPTFLSWTTRKQVPQANVDKRIDAFNFYEHFRFTYKEPLDKFDFACDLKMKNLLEL